MKQIEWVFVVALIVLAYIASAIFVGFALVDLLETRRQLARCSGRARGRVVGFEPDEKGCSRPRFEFSHAGNTVIITGALGSRPPAYRIGQVVPVRFPPEEPEKALIVNFKELYQFPMCCGLIGAVSLLSLSILILQQFLKR